jgi:nucleotide-binding universal stress UspA family protein
MKILIAVDGSSYTKKALAYLTAHDEWLGAAHQYTALTVVTPVPPRAAAVLDKETLKNYYQEEGDKVLKPIRSFFSKRGIAAECISKVGSAADVISKTAESGDFDLLMMGSHGQGNLMNLVLGSVANKVLAHCKTPVLLVR